MANGDVFLSIKMDKSHWDRMTDQDRSDHTFWCLCYLVEEAQKNKLTERILTFAGSFLASLVALVPTIWVIFKMING